MKDFHCSKDSMDFKSQNEKQIFIVNNTEHVGKNRKTTLNLDFPPKRTFTFKYYFNIKGHRVIECKCVNLTFWAHCKCLKNPFTMLIQSKMLIQVTLNPMERGLKKNTGVPENLKNDVRNHITSFTVIESHYCRAHTKKKYLKKSLSIKKCSNFFKKNSWTIP